MEIAKIYVNGVRGLVLYGAPIPAGIVGATVRLTYSERWDGLHKTVVFKGVEARNILNAGDVVTIPPEVVAKPGYRLQMGVYGFNDEGTIVIPTLWADLGIVRDAADPALDKFADSALPVWAQLQVMIGDLEELSTEAKNSLVAAVNELAKRSGGEVDPEEVWRLVEDYLAENPVEVSGAVKTVNGVAPDENGNVAITIPGDSQSSGSVLSVPFKTQVIGQLFEQPLPYTAWCSGSLHYDASLGKFVDLLYGAPQHVNPEYTASYITYIDPKTYEATEPVLCKHYDADGVTELDLTYAGRPAFLILQDGSYLKLLDVDGEIYKFVSTDHGQSWTKQDAVSGFSGGSGVYGVSEVYGFIRLSNGRILANATSRVINYSDDDGTTWSNVTPIGVGGNYEGEYFFLEVKPGVVIGLCRKSLNNIGIVASGDAEHALLTISEDYGKTWSALKISDTIDNMNCSTCTGYVHDGIVEIFAGSRWYHANGYAVTDYTNTGKCGAITHYVATIENALSDKFTKLGIIAYSNGQGDTAAMDFHTPCIAVNGNDMLLTYFDRVEPAADGSVNHHYIRGSLDGIDYGVRDDLENAIFPLSSAKVNALLRKTKNEIIVMVNEAILSGGLINPGEDEDGNPTSYILDGVIANFNFADSSKMDTEAKTITDTINGIVATCDDETFPTVRANSVTFSKFYVPAIAEHFEDTTNASVSFEVCGYREDGDTWDSAFIWKHTKYYNVTEIDRGQYCYLRYLDASGSAAYIMSNSLNHGESYHLANAPGFYHFVLVFDITGTISLYKNGELYTSGTPESFSGFIQSMFTDVTTLQDALKSYRIYNRALTAEEVVNNYKFELTTIA